MQKRALEKYPRAKCLDGSPAAYYYGKGARGVSQWFVYLQGGGWCGYPSLATCVERADSDLGSSKAWPNSWKGSEADSPMSTWHRLYVPYCDGGFFSGDRDNVQHFHDRLLYFRGLANLRAVFDDALSDLGMGNASEVVVGGCSSGGAAVANQIDVIRQWIPNHVFLAGLIDSLLFTEPLGHPNYEEIRKRVITLTKVHNFSSSPRCALPKSDRWRCRYIEHLSPQTPIFLLQSKFDPVFINEYLGPAPADEDVNWLGNRFVQTVRRYLSQNEGGIHGAYIDSCWHHCSRIFGKWNVLAPRNMVTQYEAFQEWYKDRLAAFQNKMQERASSRRHYEDSAEHPCETCCASLDYTGVYLATVTAFMITVSCSFVLWRRHCRIHASMETTKDGPG